MSNKYVLTKKYVWMVVSNDGLLKTPKDKWGEDVFPRSYFTKDDAIADYQRYIDDDIDCPHTMVLIEQFSHGLLFEDT